MGVVLGTLTTKDGQVIPLPTAIDEIEEPADEYRKEEEKRYAKCIRRARSGNPWGEGGRASRPVSRSVAWYMLRTQNLKLTGGINMNEKMYDTGVFKLFLALFQNPNMWLGTARLGELTGIPTKSITVLMRRSVNFLKDEGLMEEKDDPVVPRAKLLMFKGQCDDPMEEARIWYARMRDRSRARQGVRKAPVAGVIATPPAKAPAASTPNGKRKLVEVDLVTQEAIIRVPLSRLGAVLNFMQS